MGAQCACSGQVIECSALDYSKLDGIRREKWTSKQTDGQAVRWVRLLIRARGVGGDHAKWNSPVSGRKNTTPLRWDQC